MRFVYYIVMIIAGLFFSATIVSAEDNAETVVASSDFSLFRLSSESGNDWVSKIVKRETGNVRLWNSEGVVVMHHVKNVVLERTPEIMRALPVGTRVYISNSLIKVPVTSALPSVSTKIEALPQVRLIGSSSLTVSAENHVQMVASELKAKPVLKASKSSDVPPTPAEMVALLPMAYTFSTIIAVVGLIVFLAGFLIFRRFQPEDELDPDPGGLPLFEWFRQRFRLREEITSLGRVEPSGTVTPFRIAASSVSQSALGRTPALSEEELRLRISALPPEAAEILIIDDHDAMDEFVSEKTLRTNFKMKTTPSARTA